MINTMFNTVLLACAVAMATPAHAAATLAPASASVSSLQQGPHQWQVLKGKLILINGTYQDTTSYKRSLTFYFESKPGAPWLHVPIIDSQSEQALTWFSISQGEQTVADAAVVARADGVELVIAETRPGARAPIAVRWYRLTEAGEEDLDGPGRFFKKISATSYPAKAALTVELVLKKEIATKSKQ